MNGWVCRKRGDRTSPRLGFDELSVGCHTAGTRSPSMTYSVPVIAAARRNTKTRTTPPLLPVSRVATGDAAVQVHQGLARRRVVRPADATAARQRPGRSAGRAKCVTECQSDPRHSTQRATRSSRRISVTPTSDRWMLE